MEEQEDEEMDMDSMAIKLAETEARSKSNVKRIDHLECQQEETTKMLNIMSGIQTEQKHIKEDLSEVKSDVKKLTDLPGKRWEKILETAVVVIVSALVGFLLRGIAG